MVHVLFVFGASRSRGPPAEGEGQGWKWAFEPRQVTHPLPTTWCTGRCCCSGGVCVSTACFGWGPTPLLRKKMPGYMGCGGAMWASVSPMHHERVFSQLIRWSVASQNLASRLFLLHHADPYQGVVPLIQILLTLLLWGGARNTHTTHLLSTS